MLLLVQYVEKMFEVKWISFYNIFKTLSFVWQFSCISGLWRENDLEFLILLLWSAGIRDMGSLYNMYFLRISLCSLGCPEIHFVAQVGLELAVLLPQPAEY